MNKSYIDIVIVKACAFIFNKDSDSDKVLDFMRNNFLLPKYYGYDETDRNVVISGIHEMLYNAIRASHEKERNHPIKCSVNYNVDNVTIIITNGAGGFDFNKCIFKPGQPFNIMSKEGNDYRLKTGRGGLGMYMTQQIFDYFDIHFIDFDGNKCKFEDGNVLGTKVVLKLNKK